MAGNNGSPNGSGLKIAAQMSAEPSDEEFAFNRQMGVEYAVGWAQGSNVPVEYYRHCSNLFRKNGITLAVFGSRSVHCVDAIVLNLENRDAKVEEYKQHLRNLAAAGIPCTTYAHMANSVWSTPYELTRGGAVGRAFDLSRLDEAWGESTDFKGELSHGREYSEEEIWDYYTSFIRDVAPVAEEVGVRIGIHPDDPPGITLGGVPRPIFSSFEGYKRALEIADSPNVGLCLCIGCWLEGGDAMGMNVLDTIRYFGERKQIFKVHFRNVSQPLPRFVETFVDDGYMDMYAVMKALGEVGFDGVLIPDHIPVMIGGEDVGTAYSIAYMKAMRERAIAELAV